MSRSTGDILKAFGLDGEENAPLRISGQRRGRWKQVECGWAHACMLSCFSHVQLFATPWTVARQAPLSRGFSRQEYGSRLPLPSPGNLPNSGTEPASLMSPAMAGGFFTTSTTWDAPSLSVVPASWMESGISGSGREFAQVSAARAWL